MQNMVNKVHLTSSMRTNLLSLQKTTKAQGTVQERLSSGLKVNSAIDNAGSYYSARSLDHRASDLSNLLDNIGKSVQTIDAALKGLETVSNFLELGTSTIETVVEELTSASVSSYDFKPEAPEINKADAEITKEWLMEQGAARVVTTAEELINAIDYGAEDALIVVMGNIELDLQADADGKPLNTIVLRPGQKLVGTEYFADKSSKVYERGFDGGRLSSITITNKTGHDLSGITMDERSLISDLDITYETNTVSGRTAAVMNNMRGESTINNSDIRVYNYDREEAGEQEYVAGIMSYLSESKVVLTGNVNVYNEGAATIGIAAWTGSSGATPPENSAAVEVGAADGSGGNVNVVSTGEGATAIASTNSTINFRRNVVLGVVSDDGLIDGRGIGIGTGSQVYLQNTSDKLFTSDFDGPANVAIAEGANLSIKTSKVNATYNTLSTTLISMSTNDIGVFTENFDKTGASQRYFEDYKVNKIPLSAMRQIDNYNDQYKDLLGQIDDVVKDSVYQGINLLNKDEMEVRFNEDGSSKLNVEGVDATSEGLGVTTLEWNNMKSLNSSLNELAEAVKKVREYSAQLGNSYSIIVNREEFTNNLINVLEEGADKLTLADMNEEAANQMALATRQELAVNSLSLASQASQSVLKLF